MARVIRSTRLDPYKNFKFVLFFGKRPTDYTFR